ncbi:Cro/Cl family transcriptional regulator [Shewanella sp. Actino-trap-3]|jgi:DNA-binding transcriptional regulator YdaS (Cro superfamily)|uniref:Cro/CI family transcriptional regulator n=1 Tax=Shewanella sp. Actino-trap-3 TaxID=2058331 RepID=UPI000C33EEB5|nr:Cro/CI family transcriptional regulator [Shewanella sp. Actino-trap-3]PKG79859.1 Cro/Cl family transcriptional regulator [Shewanella sp. Actino-trap-3]
MKKQIAVDHFKGKSKLAKALGISPASVSQWPDDVPELRAYQIERLTNGKLKADVPRIEQVNPV